MEELYIIPDIHFQTSTVWGRKVGNNFIKWLSKNITPKENSEVICLGDIGDTFLSSGSTISLFEKFYNVLSQKFKHIYLVVGNHDLKINKFGQPELVYDYFKEKTNLTIIDQPYQILTIQHKSCIFLPHIISSELQTEKAYVKIYKEKFPNLPTKLFNYGFGHLSIEGALPRIAVSLPPSMIPAEKMFFGHLHGVDKLGHMRSVWACDPSEIGERFIYKIENDMISKVALPEFTKFETIIFPEPIKNKDDEYSTTLYTVLGNINLQMAKDVYKDVYIIKVINTLLQKKKENVEINKTDDLFTLQDLATEYKNMKEETKLKINKRTDEIVEEFLNNKEPVKKARRLLVEE